VGGVGIILFSSGTCGYVGGEKAARRIALIPILTIWRRGVPLAVWKMGQITDGHKLWLPAA